MNEQEAADLARAMAPVTPGDVALAALQRPDCAKVEFYPDGGIRAIEFRAPAREEGKAKGKGKLALLPIVGAANAGEEPTA